MIYIATIIDCDRKDRKIWGEVLENTESTKQEIRSWCSKHGHRLIEESYHEIYLQPDPAFVDSCLSDVAGFKR
jgi:hypothetical protein